MASEDVLAFAGVRQVAHRAEPTRTAVPKTVPRQGTGLTLAGGVPNHPRPEGTEAIPTCVMVATHIGRQPSHQDSAADVV